MSVFRRLTDFGFARGWGGAWRAAAAALLLAALVQPGAAPIMAARALPVAAPAPQSGCGVVVNITDHDAGSLRWTVDCVAAGATVTFQSGLAGQTIFLTTGEITVTQPITIDASGAPGVKVDAGNLSRVFNITAGGTVTLKALTLQHGKAASGNGGAVLAGTFTNLVLEQVSVLSSTAPAGQGGGLYAGGTATLTASQFVSNTSSSHAGGMWVSGNAVVTGGRFERNKCTGSGCQGGGLAGNSTLTLTGTQFITNASSDYGGGAVVAGDALLTDALFQGNQCTDSASTCSGGGLAAGALATNTLTLINTDFISNTSVSSGGGAYAQDVVVLTNGRFERNVCNGSNCQGGGLAGSQTLNLTGTQFISNTSVLYGGGVVVAGDAVLTDALFQGNKCTQSNCAGGGLAASALPTNRLTLVNTDFISNTSLTGAGGAYAKGTTVLTNGLFQSNKCSGTGCQGGGLAAAGALTVTDTGFISNTSTSSGGGVGVGGAALLTNALFQGNKCTDSVTGCGGGGLFALSSLFLTGTQFISNTATVAGGGALGQLNSALVNDRFEGNRCTNGGCLGGGLATNVNADVRLSSFSGNQSAGSGGGIGITNTSQITLANVTLSGNLAAASGGGVFAGGASIASLWNVTVADNQSPSGAGVLAQPAVTLSIRNTIFDNNGASNCFGPIAPGTHNLEWPGGACASAGGPGAGFSTADPRLAPLAQNSPGTTLTRALLLGSAARDAGDPATCAAAPVNSVDQRGVARPIRGLPGAGAAICDIGAYEAAAMVPFLWLPVVRK